MFMENVPPPIGNEYLNCGALGAVFCTHASVPFP